MAVTLNPYLAFRDNAAAAMTFYQSVLGGELQMSTFAELSYPDESVADLIMHSLLKTPIGLVVMASDTAPGQEGGTFAGFQISLSGDDAETLRSYWAGLSEGATITMPLAVAPWGDEFGMLVDKFGVAWMVDIAPTES